MKTAEYRERFLERIMDLSQNDLRILAVWEGGSAATGFLDDLSDLDIGLVVEDDSVETVFALFEKLLQDHYGISSRFRVPEPSWHGHSQCYYFLEKCPEHFYVDLLIEKRSAGNRLVEPDRHGKSKILLNRENILQPQPTPLEEREERNRRFLALQSAVLPISLTETAKQLKRGNPIDAMLEYQGLVQRRLGALLNLKYRPDRHDFGIRYGDREYPDEVSAKLQRLLYAGSLEELKPRFREVSEWAEQLVRELQQEMGGNVD